MDLPLGMGIGYELLDSGSVPRNSSSFTILSGFWNSWHYQPENAISEERTVTLVIEDTGRGISEEFLRNDVFKPFSQEDQLSTGTGLGLSFVQRITAQLGGSISITSQVSGGTKVTVSLPMTLISVSSSHESSADKDKSVKGQGTCRDLRARVVNAAEHLGHPPSPRLLAGDAMLETLCRDHIGLRLCTTADAEQLAPDVLIVTNPAIYDLSSSVTSWREVPVLVVCPNALVVHKYELACKLAGQTRLHDFVSQLLTPWKLERAISRVMGFWAESQDTPQISAPMPLPSPSDTTPLGQPMTPGIVGSPFGTLTTAEDYFHTPQFLLVEDNPVNLKIHICFMKKLKQPYQTAANGEEAVASYKGNPGLFSCVLMDISMPVMDGLEATRQIRAFERYNNIPTTLVLAITGLGSESTRDEATRSGVDFFVTKPAKLKALEEILKSRGLAV
uniref:histidine kinase n=1 Tax=Fusarium clavum TaxID=2594811 RepID=A0A090MD03_9HYPO|nr:unnamed protein product [Fusarium clavum]